MKVSKIYEEYMVPKNLQDHMLRVTAFGEIIVEQWKGSAEIDRNSIINACLFHDIAKPMNFILSNQARYGMSAEDILKLDKLQRRLKSAYGTNEHNATVKICTDIGLDLTSVRLVDNLEWEFIPRLLTGADIPALIPIYCDMRIGPNGILSLTERLLDLKDRTDGKFNEESVKNGRALENLIQQNLKIDCNSINNIHLNERFERLLNTEI